MTNHGPHDYDAEDDYPVFVLRAAEAVAADAGSLGVVLGGSGNGEQMAANKVPGIRAALCYNDELASLAREHNDAQVISIGARMNTVEEAKAMVRTFLATPFTGDARHERRIDMARRYEQDRTRCRRSRVLWIERKAGFLLIRLGARVGHRPGGATPSPDASPPSRRCLRRWKPTARSWSVADGRPSGTATSGPGRWGGRAGHGSCSRPPPCS